jgi:hypothetical protein
MFVYKENLNIKNKNMKKVSLFLAAFFLISGLAIGQTKKASWKEMADFQELMNNSFQPIKTNKFEALKENAPQLYRNSKVWYGSALESNHFSKPETMKTLESLMIRCNDLWAATDKKASNDKLKAISTEIQTMYKKVAADIKP